MYLVRPFPTEVPKSSATVSAPMFIRKKLNTNSSGKMHATNAINNAGHEIKNASDQCIKYTNYSNFFLIFSIQSL